MLYTKHPSENIIHNVLEVIAEADVIAFLLENVDWHNDQFFQKRKSQNFLKIASFKQLQLQSGLSSNITGLRLIRLETVYESKQFQKWFQMLEETLIALQEVNEICVKFLCQLYGSKHLSVSDLYYQFCELNKWK